MSKNMELLPDPSRMIEGLRDTGYQFNTAVADIIDNSIAAFAENVHVNLEMDPLGGITIEFYDDGIGMNREDLINAMKYGSDPRVDAASLGKFGLGLKTASTAFCRKLVVISRADSKDDFLRAIWDLDHISRVNKWELQVDSPSEDEIKSIKTILGNGHGTLVIWQNVDRLLKRYADPGGVYAQNALKKISLSLKNHISTVFQRFLDVDDNRAENVAIFLNHTPVSPWDPFCVSESEVVNDEDCEVSINGEEKASFNMKAFVLPRPEEFSSKDVAKLADVKVRNQGIYIYRENRLIHGPDWLKIFSKEPHYNLLRVEFSFDHRLDEAFQIDIKKSQILLNDALYEHIVDFLNPPRRAAETVYRKGKRKKASEVAAGAHDSSNRNISSKQGEMSKPHIESVDEASGEADIVNKQGKTKFKLAISKANKPQEVHIQTTDSIDDGMLWEPCLIDGELGVRINTGHPYYSKVYIPNLSEGVTVQGMDALVWGLGIAEMNCAADSTKESFVELRYEVSRNLRKLVKDLPDPIEDD